ncbi:unnamed protein product [Auanema sp. JU1783]|nr:unnamed protein product [Auanema sp. JU1783]
MSLAFIGIVVGAVAIYFLWPKGECKTSKSERKRSSPTKNIASPVSANLENTQKSTRSTKDDNSVQNSRMRKDRRSNLFQTESISLIPKVIPTPPEKPIVAVMESSVLESKKAPSNMSSSELQLPPRNVEISRINYEDDAPTAREISTPTSEASIPKTANEISETPQKTKIPTLGGVEISPLVIPKKTELDGNSTRTANPMEEKENKMQTPKMSTPPKKIETPSKQTQKIEKPKVTPTKSDKPSVAKEEPKKSNAAKPTPTVPAAAAPATPSKNSSIRNEIKKAGENEKSGRKDKKDKSSRQDKNEKKSKKEKSSTNSDRKKDKKSKKSSSKQPKSGDGA